ncbi:MAG TPA: biotin--[acetyl-CoA-carboxylase] ligase [Mycobacteriales bacterium]|nr:biotin--[acetyl-CoA-carboxylase] ligase [Mycobacteriales bacterium]
MEIAGTGGGPSYADLDRPPLLSRALSTAAVQVPPWRELHVLSEVSSTNDVVAAAARAGEPEGLVVVAESQSGGRGRLGREWLSPPRAGLTLSMLLRPAVPTDRWPWLPLLVGAAAARAVAQRSGLEVRLKWPNDLVIADRKVAGLLVEGVGEAVVVGIGLNVSTRRDELPRADATSLALELGTGEAADRAPLLLAILRAIGPDYLDWVAADGAADSVASRYRATCSSIGRTVVISLPSGEEVSGEAVDIDGHGRLVVRGPDGVLSSYSAGDVTHAALVPG